MPAFVVPTALPNTTSTPSLFICPLRPLLSPSPPPRRRVTLTRLMPRAQQSPPPLAVMVNGVPGRMAAATAFEVVSRGILLADEALTGPDCPTPTFTLPGGGPTVRLSPPSDHAACLERVKARYPALVVVDYTHPSAANPNVKRYAEAGLSFVVGTTGGDVARMRRDVEEADGVYAVVAPNMGKQIVAFQAMMEMMGREFPGAFGGYTMTVKESHQSGKADTSGTAKAVVGAFRGMGVKFDVEQIEKVREKERSIAEMGVPEEDVEGGHAFHTYRLTSPDGTVRFEFQHNVCGRQVYAAGTVDAVQFLQAQREKGGGTRIFNMIDILHSGNMS